MAAARLYSPRGDTTKNVVFRMFALSAASLLPDADVVSFSFGIPYAAPFGHRGASHSLVAALALGVVAGLIGWWQAIDRSRRTARGLKIGAFVTAVVLTHGPLDALTDGGEGVALLWPFAAKRIFFSWRPIPVSPIGAGLFSPYGFYVLRTELVSFLPFFVYALWPRRHTPKG